MYSYRDHYLRIINNGKMKTLADGIGPFEVYPFLQGRRVTG